MEATDVTAGSQVADHSARARRCRPLQMIFLVAALLTLESDEVTRESYEVTLESDEVTL